MLRHEDSSEQSAPPAAQVRVTPQELADALARLEARKDAGQRELDGTLPIGDAVQQLGLDATPEELWQEIQAHRAQLMTAPRRARQTNALRLSVVSLLALMGVSTYFLTLPAPSPPQASAIITPSVQAPIATIRLSPNLLVQDSSGVIRTLSEIGNDTPFRCNLAATATGATFSNFSADENNWTLLKHGGKLYVRGWISRMSPAALQAGTVDIHRTAGGVATGTPPVAITIPLDGFQSNPLTADDMISARNLKPDTHLYEKWQP